MSVRSRILGLAVNTLAADNEYSRSNRDKLPPPIQKQLTGKLETFSWFFIAYLESALNFEHFETKDEAHGSSVSEVIDSQRRVYLYA